MVVLLGVIRLPVLALSVRMIRSAVLIAVHCCRRGHCPATVTRISKLNHAARELESWAYEECVRASSSSKVYPSSCTPILVHHARRVRGGFRSPTVGICAEKEAMTKEHVDHRSVTVGVALHTRPLQANAF